MTLSRNNAVLSQGISVSGDITNFNTVSLTSASPLIINPTGYLSSGAITQGYWRGSTLEVDKGGTGRSTYSNGQVLIGSGTSLAANTLTAGTGITITNGSGTITIAASGGVTYATTSQAQNSTSTTTVLNPAVGRDLVYSISQYMPSTGGGTNGGSIVANTASVGLNTGTNANSTASVYLGANGSGGFMLSSSTNNTGCDWSVPRSIEVRVGRRAGPSTNAIFRVMLGGKGWPWTYGALTHHGIGFEIRNRRIWIVTHNGTSLSQQDTGVDVSASQVGLGAFRVNSDGAGNVELFVNNTKTGSTLTGGPTANTNNACNVIYEVGNGSDSVQNLYDVSPAQVITI